MTIRTELSHGDLTLDVVDQITDMTREQATQPQAHSGDDEGSRAQDVKVHIQKLGGDRGSCKSPRGSEVQAFGVFEV